MKHTMLASGRFGNADQIPEQSVLFLEGVARGGIRAVTYKLQLGISSFHDSFYFRGQDFDL